VSLPAPPVLLAPPVATVVPLPELSVPPLHAMKPMKTAEARMIAAV
jgi:hypothetical protein